MKCRGWRDEERQTGCHWCASTCQPARRRLGAQGDGADIGKTDLYTARLTIDVTPALRARIKVDAFTRGITVAEMLRDLLEHEFPEGLP